MSVGYLVVNMDIQWSSHASPVSSDWFIPQDRRPSPVPSSVSSLDSPLEWVSARHKRLEEAAKSPRQTQIRELLAKGRALQKFMEQAVDVPVAPDADSVALSTESQMLPLPHAHDSNVSLDQFSVDEQAEDTEADEEQATGPAEVLEMTFESLELEPQLITQLRRMRDASVSSRFRPMQIAVSHSDIATLFQAADSERPPLPAFTIAASLHKRLWRPSRLLTLPLPRGHLSRSQEFWFFIRCGNDDHAKRTRKSDMIATGSVLLSGSITGGALLAAANDHQGSLKLALYSQEGTNTKRLGHLRVMFRLSSLESPSGPRSLTSSLPMSPLDESYKSTLQHPSSLVKLRSTETNQHTEKRPIYESPLQLAVTIEQATVLNTQFKINQLELQSSAAIRIQYAAHPFAKRGTVSKIEHKFVKRKIQCPSISSSNVTAVFNHTDVFSLPTNEEIDDHSSLLVGGGEWNPRPTSADKQYVCSVLS